MTVRPRDDRGATTVEYGLLVFAIAAVVVAVLFSIGGLASNLFGGTCHGVATQTRSERTC
ncbi:MAG TPA: Flp family type IVb pilin [Mycobacteriales bacterium]|jgi:Flp pilus assembly pilin Flp|nr:Flp family type IVb pilin [Mycobacteriales bacterium]